MNSQSLLWMTVSLTLADCVACSPVICCMAKLDVGQFVECGFCGHLRKWVNGDLTAFRVALAITVRHLEWDLFNAQRSQCVCSVPAGMAGG